jgi:hypothetical protein
VLDTTYLAQTSNIAVDNAAALRAATAAAYKEKYKQQLSAGTFVSGTVRDETAPDSELCGCTMRASQPHKPISGCCFAEST